LPPQITPPMVAFDTPVNTGLSGNLGAQVTDPDGDPIAFKWVAGYGPSYGAVNVNGDGSFSYTPATSFTGIDRFYASASDGINPPVVFEVVIGVGSPSANASLTPHVAVVPDGVRINYNHHIIQFPITVSPAAQACEVWKMNVFQSAIDCECTTYRRTDCFDIRMRTC
jgi:hypothetical protein